MILSLWTVTLYIYARHLENSYFTALNAHIGLVFMVVVANMSLEKKKTNIFF